MLEPGQAVTGGEKFGMIKLGSRTELILPGRRRNQGPARRQDSRGQRHRCPLVVAAPSIPQLRLMRPIRAVAVLPTLFTLGNLVCGFFAIVVLARIEKPLGIESIPTPKIDTAKELIGMIGSSDPTHNLMLCGRADPAGDVVRRGRRPGGTADRAALRTSAPSSTACAIWCRSAWHRRFCW